MFLLESLGLGCESDSGRFAEGVEDRQREEQPRIPFGNDKKVLYRNGYVALSDFSPKGVPEGVVRARRECEGSSLYPGE